MSAELANRLVKELVGTKCTCGAQKRSKQTFCRNCYYSLPRDTRNSLYNRIGEGYEEAYLNAVEILKEKGEIRNGNQT